MVKPEIIGSLRSTYTRVVCLVCEERSPEGAEALAGATHLSAYYARHAARPSFQRTMPLPGPPASR